ncbi:MAG: DUF1942 domain-containing protein [Mycobacteriaceae bacterium]
MTIKKLAGVVVAAAIPFGIGAVTVAPAWATDNIKIFGEQERINDWGTGAPLIGYTVMNFSPSSAAVPHSGQLYEATLNVVAFDGWANPRIERFVARAESGDGDPVILNAPGGISGAQIPPGGSTTGKLYFDVIGDIPNSVVWNDGTRDILGWVPGVIPLEGTPVIGMGSGTSEEITSPATGSSGGLPAESSNLGEATPSVLAPAPFELTQAEVALPGFNR